MAVVNLEQLINGHRQERQSMKDRQLMVEGDHWLDGRGWIGPRPTGDNAARVLGLIKDQFVSKNVVAEMCRRHRDALIGREPQWGFVPTRPLGPTDKPNENEQTLIDDAEAALTEWWDDHDAHTVLQDAVMNLLWAKLGPGLGTRAPIRIYLPAEQLDLDPETNTRYVPKGKLQEVLKYISIDALSPLAGGVIYDPDGQEMLGYYSYKEEDRQRIEVVATAKVLNKYDALRDSYPDDTTVVQVRENGNVIEEAGYDIGGALLIKELKRREPLITDSILSQQKLTNMAYTMMGRNVVLGGFLERVILNAQAPGQWVDDKGNPDPQGTKFQPDPVNVGAGSTNFFSGMPILDETGKVTGYTSPSVQYRDPVSVQTFRDTIQETKFSMYEEAQQLHVLISGDSTSSGTSRKQATNDFVASLGPTATTMQRVTRWLLETVLAMGTYFSNEQNRFEPIRAEVNARITAVQPSADEIKSNLDQYNAGTLSLETTMSRNGVDDVAAEQARIEADMAKDAANRPPLIPGDPYGQQQQQGQGGAPPQNPPQNPPPGQQGQDNNPPQN